MNDPEDKPNITGVSPDQSLPAAAASPQPCDPCCELPSLDCIFGDDIYHQVFTCPLCFSLWGIHATGDDDWPWEWERESDSAGAPKCRYAFPGTWGCECGAPATNVLVTEMSQATKTELLCMGGKVPDDGMSRAGRCDAHRNIRESADGAFVRTERIPEMPS